MTIEPIEHIEPVKQPGILRVSLFLLCAAVFLVAGYAVWSGVDANHRADSLAKTLAQHDKDAATDRATAADDRATAAANQAALVGYVQEVADQQAAENAWLRSHHIPIPARFVTVIRPPRIVVRHPRAAHHVKRSRPTRSRHSRAPGHSGRAPGHRKHHGHGHGYGRRRH